MVNSYVHVAPDPAPVSPLEAIQRYQQGEFLRRNHHLISPWMYSSSEIAMRNRALMLMHFDRAPRPMKPLAEGGIAVDELPA